MGISEALNVDRRKIDCIPGVLLLDFCSGSGCGSFVFSCSRICVSAPSKRLELGRRLEAFPIAN